MNGTIGPAQRLVDRRFAFQSERQREPDMNKMMIFSAALCAVSLSACSKSPSENLADRVENAADAQADTMENQADMLKAQAAEVRENGEQRSDAIEAADQNIAAMPAEQTNAIVAGEAPAVK
jgi:outer membrane murein-binding lipoprotein Lpp